jgi:hypothetical protein
VGAFRLRRRSKWVNRLSDLAQQKVGFVGGLVHGRWRPDLPMDGRPAVANFLAAMVVDGVRILGGGFTQPGGDEAERLLYLNVQLKVNGRVSQHTVFPELAAYLSCLGSYKPRDYETWMSLRLRALDWCRKKGLAWTQFHEGFHGSILLGFLRSAAEESVVGLLKHGLGVKLEKGT